MWKGTNVKEALLLPENNRNGQEKRLARAVEKEKNHEKGPTLVVGMKSDGKSRMNLYHIPFYTILIAIFASASVHAGGIQSTQAMVINGPAVKWPVKPGEMPAPLSSTNIVWDCDVKATNVVAGANTRISFSISQIFQEAISLY
jgi:hypothetical protein